MNLRKATKSQLIKEVRRLRPFENKVKELRLEIKRRDNASSCYRNLEKTIIQWATVLALKRTAKEKDLAWEQFWNQMHEEGFDEFWAERCADRIAEFADGIEDVLGELQIK